MNQKELINLVEDYHRYSKAYYEDKELISDVEFDKLEKEILSYKEEYPNIVRRVEIVGSITNGLPFKHKIRMYSLDKVHSLENLLKWMKGFPNTTEFSLELKYDGISIDLSYNNGRIDKAITRGDGLIGTDILDNIIEVVPDKVKSKYKNIHGELIMRNIDFTLANTKRVLNNKELYKNPRNAVNAEAIHGAGFGNLTFIPYNFYNEDGKLLNPKKFNKYRIPNTVSTTGTCKELFKELKELYKNKPTNIPIDGLVIKILDKDLIEELGFTNKFPRFALALKYPADEDMTILKDVVWQVGYTGTITPVGIIEPVDLEGALVSRVTLNNLNFVLEKELAYNSKVKIIRSGSVIPKLVGVEHIDEGERITIPSMCPECQSPTKVQGPNLFCNNVNCRGRVVSLLTRFVSRDHADIKDVSRKLIEKIYDKGVNDIYGLITVRREMLEDIEGLKDKSINNILNAIDAIKGLPMDKFLSSLGIKGLGKTNSKTIAESMGELEDIFKLDITNQKGIGLSTSIDISTGLIINHSSIKALGKELNPTIVERETLDKTVCITGKDIDRSRNELIDFYKKDGYRSVKSVSKNLDLLVFGDEGSESKRKKALELDIDVIYLNY